MSKTRLEWIVAAVVVLALVVGAYPIVQARNRSFYSAGQEAAAPLMH